MYRPLTSEIAYFAKKIHLEKHWKLFFLFFSIYRKCTLWWNFAAFVKDCVIFNHENEIDSESGKIMAGNGLNSPVIDSYDDAQVTLSCVLKMVYIL
jgi:hypothetical protein